MALKNWLFDIPPELLKTLPADARERLAGARNNREWVAIAATILEMVKTNVKIESAAEPQDVNVSVSAVDPAAIDKLTPEQQDKLLELMRVLKAATDGNGNAAG